MVQIQMRIAQGVHELAHAEPARLGDHMREQRIACDIERHPEKHVTAALIELTGQPPLRDIELKQGMTRRQRHVIDLGRVPGRDQMPA